MEPVESDRTEFRLTRLNCRLPSKCCKSCYLNVFMCATMQWQLLCEVKSPLSWASLYDEPGLFVFFF